MSRTKDHYMDQMECHGVLPGWSPPAEPYLFKVQAFLNIAGSSVHLSCDTMEEVPALAMKAVATSEKYTDIVSPDDRHTFSHHSGAGASPNGTRYMLTVYPPDSATLVFTITVYAPDAQFY